MGLWTLVIGWWDDRCRRMDLKFLLPSLIAQAEDLEQAMLAFAAHCLHDPAWRALGEDELTRRLDALYTDLNKELMDH